VDPLNVPRLCQLVPFQLATEASKPSSNATTRLPFQTTAE
jgi:hypothetical protein